MKVPTTCTSGGPVKALSLAGKACGWQLIYLNGAIVCPKCDGLPKETK